MHFRSLLAVDIQNNLEDSYGPFSKINLVEFKRVLSNLINNSVEAFENNSGVVRVYLKEIPFSHGEGFDNIQIIIEDNGKGIPESIISKLGKKGASFGKENHETAGSGLGLYHAKNTVESWCGKFDIESEVGIGTKMILTLPKEKAPHWFVSEIVIEKKIAIVILDDDQGIHQTWDKKFKDKHILDNQIFHLSCPKDFSKWMEEKSQFFEKTLYLCDFELIGFDKSGLDLIEEYALGSSSVLVTSHYKEEDIQNRCKQLGIKLIPKMIVAHVPVTVESSDLKECIELSEKAEKQKFILLDDDILTRMVWESKAKEKGIDLEVFEFPNEIYSRLDGISKDTIYYIDASLANDQKGEDVALNLFNKGHKNLFLATGYEPDLFETLDYLKGVIGKSPPW